MLLLTGTMLARCCKGGGVLQVWCYNPFQSGEHLTIHVLLIWLTSILVPQHKACKTHRFCFLLILILKKWMCATPCSGREEMMSVTKVLSLCTWSTEKIQWASVVTCLQCQMGGDGTFGSIKPDMHIVLQQSLWSACRDCLVTLLVTVE